MENWSGILFLGVFGALFAALAVLFLHRSRQRRREMFAEDTPRPLPQADDAEAPADQPEEPPPPARDLEAEAAKYAGLDRESDEPAPAPVADETLKRGMERTSSSFLGRLNQLLRGKPAVDPALLDELEELLLTADVGVAMTTSLMDDLRSRLARDQLGDPEIVRATLRERMQTALNAGQNSRDPLALGKSRPHVILFVGVNGVGKTTTIGKVAQKFIDRGIKVLLAAGDTFRAAATEQLQIWGERVGAEVVRGSSDADPASVIFNAIEKGKHSGAEVVLADTAGRLHTKSELMDEIKKVQRAAGKARDGAPDEVWLVVDATTGQNALIQAREFHQTLGLSGIILTKLDGTARGGVVVAIADSLKIPVRFIGVGEKAEDLRPFSADAFVDALFSP